METLILSTNLDKLKTVQVIIPVDGIRRKKNIDLQQNSNVTMLG